MRTQGAAGLRYKIQGRCVNIDTTAYGCAYLAADAGGACGGRGRLSAAASTRQPPSPHALAASESAGLRMASPAQAWLAGHGNDCISIDYHTDGVADASWRPPPGAPQRRIQVAGARQAFCRPWGHHANDGWLERRGSGPADVPEPYHDLWRLYQSMLQATCGFT